MNLALDNLQRLIYHKTQTTNLKVKSVEVILLLSIYLSIFIPMDYHFSII